MVNNRSYEQHGPKAVILFHAFTGTPTDVTSVGRALEREGYTVVTPTLDGHGEEDPDVILDYGVEDWLKNAEDAYQMLVDDGYKNISVFGLSLGGIIATHTMLNHDVKTYGVFSSPVLSTEEGTNVPENFWIWYKFKKKKLGIDEQEVEASKPQVMERLDKLLDGIEGYVKSMTPQYPEVELPVFIAQGGKDEMINPDIAYAFKDQLKNAVVDFHWYDEAPHVITIGRAGKETQKDLIAFLNKYA